MKKEYHSVALDSDMVINLSKYNDPTADVSKMRKEDLNRLRIINKLNLEGKLDFIVLPLVLGEMYPSGKVMDFIDTRCVVVEIYDEHIQDHIEKTNNLASIYTSTKCGNKPVMDELYNASLRKRIPANDAYIMAEATILNLCVLTNNVSDYITFRDEVEPKRAWEIENINQKEGYSSYDSTPRPVSPKYICDKVTNGRDLNLSDMNEDLRGTYYELD